MHMDTTWAHYTLTLSSWLVSRPDPYQPSELKDRTVATSRPSPDQTLASSFATRPWTLNHSCGT
eukprot:2175267-Alexandrium_andersonii.AAC.1